MTAIMDNTPCPCGTVVPKVELVCDCGCVVQQHETENHPCVPMLTLVRRCDAHTNIVT